MPIDQTTSQSEINDAINGGIENLLEAITQGMEDTGELAVNTARSYTKKNDWQDDTGNLRSSIGSVVVCDGKVTKVSSFETIKDGANGSSQGRSYAQTKASESAKGIDLTVVAGMEYARYVSAKRDVLDSAMTAARKEIPKMLQALGLKKK